MRPSRLTLVALALAALAAAGCRSEQESTSPAPEPAPVAPKLSGLPIEMTVKQRSTTVVPGSGGAVSLTIDDVTRGQVMVSLAGKDGSVVLGATSLAEGKSAEFKLGDESYFVLLEELDNELVGDDSATLVISDSPPTDEAAPSEAASESKEVSSTELEREKVKQLIEHIGSLKGAVFIRNGQEHTPAEAAAHFRRKWEAAAGEIATAEEFINKAASKSSLSGEPYRIRLNDGTESPSGEYLRKWLGEMEAD